tara:strand:+ start:33519 stop:33965 length:447 start_codon:yes stop_codon:yes gene_type:complete
MTKIDKNDLENINLLFKECKDKKFNKLKIKKGDYEIEITKENLIQNENKILSKNSNINNSTNEIKLKSNKNENIVKSPMVGVAYLSADPNSPQYVKEGQHVKAGETLLLIEAMKTFNEIKAPKSGVIKKILALNSQPVEFGEDLIIIE